MKGRGEHPVDVSLEILAVASQRLDLAGLEYTSPDERLELARARGRLDGACELARALEHGASGGVVPKALRLVLAEHVREARVRTTTCIGSLQHRRAAAALAKVLHV